MNAVDETSLRDGRQSNDKERRWWGAAPAFSQVNRN